MINHQRHNVRVASIFFFFVMLYAFVLFNLYSVQIRQTGYFKTLAKQQYHVVHTTMPPRAEIYDRFGQPLAMNKESTAAFIMPSRLEQPKEIKQFLLKHFGQAAQRLEKQDHTHFMYIKRRLTQQQIDLLENSGLADIKFLKEPSRFYPVESLGPVVGITDINNNGLFGLEFMYNNLLAGKASTHILEKDARSGRFYFKRETKVHGALGHPITLSIDSILQFLTYEELKEAAQKLEAQEAAALILDPTNGEILALVNYPDFNPNSTEDLAITSTKNRVITDAYELGSVIKAFLALAALEEQVVTPEELIDCENKKETFINGFRFSTWKAHGIIPFAEVIQGSNNIGVAKIAQRLGPKLYEHYVRLGFGEKLDLFPGENKGFINPPDKWSKASIITLSFGYEMSATLVQLAQALGVIANDGYLIKPRIIKATPDETIEKKGPLYKSQSIKQLKAILSSIIPPALAQKVQAAGITVMGKTGTARLLTNGKYEANRNIFTFMGIVQKKSYKRIVITFIKEIKQKNVYSSTIALPVFEQIMDKMLMHEKML